MSLSCPKCKSTFLVDAERTVREPGAFEGFNMKYCYCGSYWEVKGGKLKPWPEGQFKEERKLPVLRGKKWSGHKRLTAALKAGLREAG